MYKRFQEENNYRKGGPKIEQWYNLRSQGAPTLIDIPKEKLMQMFTKVGPPVPSRQKTQNKSRKIAPTKDISMSSSLENTPLDSTNTSLPPDISVSLSTLDYNIVEDIKKTHVNIYEYKLTKLIS